MKIETLVATMNRKSFDFLEGMNIKTDTIVINQTDHRASEQRRINENSVTIIHDDKRGLSRSRNLALDHSTADICVIADDDMIYQEDYDTRILKAYKDHPEADIIAFIVHRKGNDKRQKQFRKEKNWENYLTSMKISSVEITFKRERILEKGIRFNENIGAGTAFPNGEESTFLYECLRKGLKVLYLPLSIGEVDVSESTWHEGYNKKHFYAVGARFYNMTKRYNRLLMLQFALRKYKEYKDEASFSQVLKWMNEGKKSYIETYEEE